MVVAVAEALVAAGGAAPTTILDRVAAHYEPARGFGRGMKIAVSAFRSGLPWEEWAFAAWPEGSAGNGGAVRVVAVALPTWASSTALADAAYLTTRATHAHPDAIAMAQLQAYVIQLLLKTPSLADTPDRLGETIRETFALPPVSIDRLDAVLGALRADVPSDSAALLFGTSPLAVESVPGALWAFLSDHSSFAASVSRAASLGGDVDSICSLAGAIAGAYHGASALPRHWLSKLGHEQPSLDHIRRLSGQLRELDPLSPHEDARHARAADDQRRATPFPRRGGRIR